MLRGILIMVLIIAIVVGGWMVYRQYTGGVTLGSGDVALRQTPAEKDRSDASYDLDGNQKTTTYDRNAAPPQGAGAATNQPPADKKAMDSGSGTQLTGPAPEPQNATAAQIAAQNTPAQSPTALPVSDTIPRNPPNGAVFTGSGKYTWYRQGNITWRVNSANGAACIAFATMEEWQKQLVYLHGCGNA